MRRAWAHRSTLGRVVARGIALSPPNGDKRGMRARDSPPETSLDTTHDKEVAFVVEAGGYETTETTRKRSRPMLGTSALARVRVLQPYLINSQANAYGQCVLRHYKDASKGMCEKEFLEFKNCVQQIVS